MAQFVVREILAPEARARLLRMKRACAQGVCLRLFTSFALTPNVAVSLVFLISTTKMDLLEMYSMKGFFCVNLCALFLYGYDKQRAKNREPRVPSIALWLFSVIGGCYGATAGELRLTVV